jgi:hypothetical protein
MGLIPCVRLLGFKSPQTRRVLFCTSIQPHSKNERKLNPNNELTTFLNKN